MLQHDFVVFSQTRKELKNWTSMVDSNGWCERKFGLPQYSLLPPLMLKSRTIKRPRKIKIARVKEWTLLAGSTMILDFAADACPKISLCTRYPGNLEVPGTVVCVKLKLLRCGKRIR